MLFKTSSSLLLIAVFTDNFSLKITVKNNDYSVVSPQFLLKKKKYRNPVLHKVKLYEPVKRRVNIGYSSS